MGLRKQPYIISELTCPECGKIFPIPRWKGAKRSHGHIKDIWCPYCKGIKKFVEG